MEGRVRVMSGKECRCLLVPAGCPAPLTASPPPLPSSGSAVTVTPGRKAGRPRGMKLEEWTRGVESNKWLKERCTLCSVTAEFTKNVLRAPGRDAAQKLPLCRCPDPWLIINASDLPRSRADLGG